MQSRSEELNLMCLRVEWRYCSLLAKEMETEEVSQSVRLEAEVSAEERVRGSRFLRPHCRYRP